MYSANLIFAESLVQIITPSGCFISHIGPGDWCSFRFFYLKYAGNFDIAHILILRQRNIADLISLPLLMSVGFGASRVIKWQSIEIETKLWIVSYAMLCLIKNLICHLFAFLFLKYAYVWQRQAHSLKFNLWRNIFLNNQTSEKAYFLLRQQNQCN